LTENSPEKKSVDQIKLDSMPLASLKRDTASDTWKPPAYGNLAAGLLTGAANTADQVLTDPGEWWGRHSKKTQEHMGARLKRAQDDPFIGFAKNVGQGGLEMLLFLPMMAAAFNDASRKGPEAVTELTEAIPGAIATGIGYIATNPEDAMIADPVGTVATMFGAVRGASAAKLKFARGRVPAGQRNKFDQFVELAHENFDKLGNAPLFSPAKKAAREAKDGVSSALDTPIPRTEVRGKTVRQREAGDRLDIGGGAEPLRVRDVVGAALKGGGVMHLASGGLSLAPAMVGFAAYPIFLATVASARAGRGKLSNKLIGGWERLAKTVSGASDMGTEAAIAGIMSESAKADSVLGAAIRDIRNQIDSGRVTEAIVALNRLSEDPAVINTVISSKIGQGTAGDVISRVVKARGKENPKYEALHPDLKESVGNALLVLERTLGDDKIGPSTLAKIEALANLDSVSFGASEQMRNALRIAAEKKLGRTLKREERDHLDRRARQYAGLSLVEFGPVSGKVRITDKNGDGKGVILDVRSEYNKALLELSPAKRNDLLGEVIIDTVSSHRSSLRSKAHQLAIEKESYRVTSKATREALKGDEQSSGAISHGSRQVDILYAGDVARAVVGRGDATPLVAPLGIDFRAIAMILKLDPESAARAAIGDSLAANPEMMKQAVYRVRTLARELDNSTTHRASRLSSPKDRDLESGRSIRELLSDLESDGVPTEGMLSNIKVLADIERAHSEVGKMSMRQPLADTLWWLDSMSRDANVITRYAHSARGAVKLGLTAYSTAVHLGNALANILFTAADRGNSIPSVVASNARTAAKLLVHLRGDKKSMTKFDQEVFSMISEMGFRLGDMTTADLRSFLRASDTLFGFHDSRHIQRAKTLLSEELPGVSHAVRGVKTVTKSAKDLYSLGDTVPKADEAFHSIVYIRKMMDDVEPGHWIEADTHAGLHRRFDKGDDGHFYIAGKRATTKQIRDFQMGYARRRANERFKDFSQRPGLLRALEYVPLGNTFSHWALKATGAGDPGMGTILARGSKGVRTNSRSLNLKIATQEAYLNARRSLMIQSTKAWDDEDRKTFAEIGSRYNKGLGIMLATASSRPGNIVTRDMGSIASLGPQIAVYSAVATIANNLLYDGARSKLRRSAGGLNRDSNLMDSMYSALSVLQLEGGVLDKVMDLLLKSSPAWKKRKSIEFFKKGFIGGTPVEFLSFLVDVLKEEGIVDLTDGYGTYYDYLHSVVPPAQRRDRTKEVINRLGGPLGDRETAVIVSKIGKTRHNWTKAVYVRDLDDFKGNLRKNYWEPVAKKYGPRSSESRQAFAEIQEYYGEYMLSLNKGYKSVFGEYPPISQQRGLFVTQKTLRGWIAGAKKGQPIR
jgi:hypothetical protein